MIPFFPFFQLPSLRLASFTIQVFGLFAAVDTYVGARRAASAQWSRICRDRLHRQREGSMSGTRRRSLTAVIAVLTVAGPCPASAAARTAAPFALPDLTGRNVSLSSLHGHVVIVNFWATWCVPCMFEIPGLASFWRRHHDRCLEVLGIAEEFDDENVVARTASRLQTPYPVLLDDDGAVATRYRVPGYPYTAVIDGLGKLRRVFKGVVTEKELEAAVSPLLSRSAHACPAA